MTDELTAMRVKVRQPTQSPLRWAGLLILSVLVTACSTSKPSSEATPTSTSAPASAPVAPLWGEMKPVVSVRELMRYMIDPVADNIFNSVSTVITKQGTVETAPKTDADWEKIQVGAISLAEGAYLLKVPRPFAPPGDLNNSTGPNPVELSPDQITAKVERDPVEWNARIETLRNASLAVLDIVKKKDVNALWEAGEVLDQACENCHRSYWYPGEDAQFYRSLRRRIEEARERRSKIDNTAPSPTRAGVPQ